MPVRLLSAADRAVWAAYTTQLAGSPQPAPAVARAMPPGPVARAAIPARFRPLIVDVAPDGLDKASWQRFRSGQLAVGRRLDLHGTTVQRAYERFSQLVCAASAQGVRCVEVITGRGSGEAGGVLRRELPLWINLPQIRPLLLAASHPNAANHGAVRLLLRRKEGRGSARNPAGAEGPRPPFVKMRPAL